MDMQAGSLPGWNVRKPGKGQRVRRHLSTPVPSVCPVLCPGELYTHTSLAQLSIPACTPGTRGVMLSHTSLSHPVQ